jgi:hypothetical protein
MDGASPAIIFVEKSTTMDTRGAAPKDGTGAPEYYYPEFFSKPYVYSA